MKLIKKWFNDVLDAAYGIQVFDEKDLDYDELLLEFNDFPDDEYMLEWRITHVFKRRLSDHAPHWAKKVEHIGFYAYWTCREGIPYKNREYSGLDEVMYRGEVKIDNPFDWRYDACKTVEDRIRMARLVGSYIPPIIDMRQQDIESIDHVIDEELQEFIETPPDNLITEGGEIIMEMPIDKVDGQVMHGPYPEEQLNVPDPDSKWGGVLLEDDGTMEDGVKNLREAIIGHKIVKIEKDVERPGHDGWYDNKADVVFTLDDGRRVAVIAQEDCCAYGAVEGLVEKLPTLDHIITDVATTDGYTKWHILADMTDVLELEIGWSPGNPFYYPYGVFIEVYDIPQEGVMNHDFWLGFITGILLVSTVITFFYSSVVRRYKKAADERKASVKAQESKKFLDNLDLLYVSLDAQPNAFGESITVVEKPEDEFHEWWTCYKAGCTFKAHAPDQQRLRTLIIAHEDWHYHLANG